MTRCVHAKSLHLCQTLSNPMDCSPVGSSVHGILQARILECIAIYFSRGSSQPRDWTRVSCIAGRLFNICAIREAWAYYWPWIWIWIHCLSILLSNVLVVQLCLPLCGPMDCNPPGSCVHRIFQARMLEWVAMPSPRGFSWYRDRTCVSCISCIAGRFSTTELLGKPTMMRTVTD